MIVVHVLKFLTPFEPANEKCHVLAMWPWLNQVINLKHPLAENGAKFNLEKIANKNWFKWYMDIDKRGNCGMDITQIWQTLA